jgi:hypothetical protein
MDLSPISAIGPPRDESKLGSTQPVIFQNDPRQSPVRKRRCFECGAFLSRYNREDCCFIHELPHVQRFTW